MNCKIISWDYEVLPDSTKRFEVGTEEYHCGSNQQFVYNIFEVDDTIHAYSVQSGPQNQVQLGDKHKNDVPTEVFEVIEHQQGYTHPWLQERRAQTQAFQPRIDVLQVSYSVGGLQGCFEVETQEWHDPTRGLQEFVYRIDDYQPNVAKAERRSGHRFHQISIDDIPEQVWDHLKTYHNFEHPHNKRKAKTVRGRATLSIKGQEVGQFRGVHFEIDKPEEQPPECICTSRDLGLHGCRCQFHEFMEAKRAREKNEN